MKKEKILKQKILIDLLTVVKGSCQVVHPAPRKLTVVKVSFAVKPQVVGVAERIVKAGKMLTALVKHIVREDTTAVMGTAAAAVGS